MKWWNDRFKGTKKELLYAVTPYDTQKRHNEHKLPFLPMATVLDKCYLPIG
jgi:hypothetical protein